MGTSLKQNTVIAGDYKNKQVISVFGKPFISPGMFKGEIWLNSDNVETYEVAEETSKKSGTSAVGRSLVGGALLGPAGLFAGVTAKEKGTT